jgi:hypothetical protein
MIATRRNGIDPGKADYLDGSVIIRDGVITQLTVVVTAPGPDATVRFQRQTVVKSSGDGDNCAVEATYRDR